MGAKRPSAVSISASPARAYASASLRATGLPVRRWTARSGSTMRAALGTDRPQQRSPMPRSAASSGDQRPESSVSRSRVSSILSASARAQSTSSVCMRAHRPYSPSRMLWNSIPRSPLLSGSKNEFRWSALSNELLRYRVRIAKPSGGNGILVASEAAVFPSRHRPTTCGMPICTEWWNSPVPSARQLE